MEQPLAETPPAHQACRSPPVEHGHGAGVNRLFVLADWLAEHADDGSGLSRLPRAASALTDQGREGVAETRPAFGAQSLTINFDQPQHFAHCP
jgi:hypothetical protein